MNDQNTLAPDEAVGLVGDQDYNLWVLLQNTRDAMAAVRAEELAKCGLSDVEAAVLLVVQVIERGGTSESTPAEIARWLFRKPHSITGLMNRMEKKGLVRRVNDLEKKNRVRITLTPKGLETYRCSEKREKIKGVLSSLPEEDRERLWSYLQALRDTALNHLGTRHKPPFPHLR